MTLDEWKALQNKTHELKTKTTFNIRKAGEGVDDAQWKKTYVLSKKKPPHSEEDEEEESDDVSKTGPRSDFFAAFQKGNVSAFISPPPHTHKRWEESELLCLLAAHL